MPNGYLGVDIFYTISGYLITRIIGKEIENNEFSLKNFYLRRIRRILPLVSVIVTTSLVLGCTFMLPDDLENLCQSIVATNFFVNNILLLITTKDYWDIVNEYKPLMHTWSLAVEEQFYFVYPLTFVFFAKKNVKSVFYVLVFVTIVSFISYLSSKDDSSKFYLLHYRYYELSLGGLVALLLQDKLVVLKYRIIVVIFLLFMLSGNYSSTNGIANLFAVSLSLLIIISKDDTIYSSFLLENRLVVYLGKISFGLYMWHQVILAFYRYIFSPEITFYMGVMLTGLIVLASIFTYYFIEIPFRSRNKFNDKLVVTVILSITAVTTVISFVIYTLGGIIRDVPELGLTRNAKRINLGSGKRNINIEYNARVYDLNKPFIKENKIRVLAIGNSMSRDWVNVLLESNLKDTIEISYVDYIEKCPDFTKRLSTADLVFFSNLGRTEYDSLSSRYKFDYDKIRIVGIKAFGENNGVFYNKKKDNLYCNQRISISNKIIDKNNNLKNEWGKKYIDILECLSDDNNTVPVFTNDCKFISQDCLHLTKSGAGHIFRKLSKGSKRNYFFDR